MTKPVVFFSHSARDKKSLLELRERFLVRTGRSIDVFMSSDGQSIRFGTNWVSEIQRALDGATLMFVFLSPNALGSRWVPFEAGHAYGRKIQVVPVGLWGVKIEEMGPPLSLLNGFNITSRESLSNLIAIVNESLGVSHRGFDDDDFASIFAGGVDVSPLGHYGHAVEEVRVLVSGKSASDDSKHDLYGDLSPGWRARAKDDGMIFLVALAKELGVGVPMEGTSVVRTPGLRAAFSEGTRVMQVEIYLEPETLSTTWSPVISSVNQCLGKVDERETTARVVFVQQVVAETKDHKITGRLVRDGVLPAGDQGWYRWRDMDFSLEDKGFSSMSGGVMLRPVELSVRPLRMATLTTIQELVALLFERGVLAVVPEREGQPIVY